MDERVITSESTNSSRALELAREGAKYDFKVKEVLSDKQILARILIHAVEDFAEETIDSIIASLGETQVASVPLEAGHTNLGKERIRFLMNEEAQKSTASSKLGYHLWFLK